MRKFAPYLSFLRDIAIGVLLWFLLTRTVGEARIVPTPSMVPTIMMGDRLWTDKLMLHFRPIARGDIVVFTPPPQVKSADPYIKRVIGLPGDIVQVKAGTVFVNSQPLTEPYVNEKPDYVYGPVTIPAGDYLVLGDNRNNSNDGHLWGFLSRDAIISRAVYRIWPVSRFGAIK
ncbi:MAG TPA: signal peptidase I [Symbiobacteriaceae bacterium]|jgi:signal peptidase I